jgi:hypothetical protein
MSATVQFLTNEKGRKTAVVLDIDAYEKLMEDLDDLAVIAERRDEATIPHAELKKGLRRNQGTGSEIENLSSSSCHLSFRKTNRKI